MVRLTPPMSSDVKIPEWAREEARIVYEKSCDAEPSSSECREIIALALLAAEQRGRKAGLEEAATVAGAFQAVPRLFPHGGSLSENEAAEAGQEYAADEIAAAIRSLGDKI